MNLYPAAAVIGLLAVQIATGAAMLPLVLRFMHDHRLTARNYAQISIPTGLGCFIWLLHIEQLMLLEGLEVVRGSERGIQSSFAAYLAALSIVFVAGWLDDTIGDRTVKGWKGHWQKWKRSKTLTTGWLKAAGTGCAAFIAVAEVGAERFSLWVAILQVLLLVLMTNAFNLLDLRPGRAIKTFILLSAAIVTLSSSGLPILLLLPSVAAALVLLPGDLGARHMLGDAGANVLGFAAGYGLIGCTPIWVQGLAFFLLLGLHRYAEQRSISAWIDEHRLASWLDRWGRA